MPLYSPKRRASFAARPAPRLTSLASVLSPVGASGSGCPARALPIAASTAAAIPVMRSASRVFMSRPYRRNVRSLLRSVGLFVPWMLVWQLRHPRAIVFAEVLVPPSEAMLPRWLVGSWHDWQRNGERILRRFGLVVPCGLWQMVQSSCTGWWVRTNGPRFSLWQAKHTSDWVSLSRTGSLATCSLWHDEHDTSLRSCLLPCQWMRVRPWWQVRHTSFFSEEDILEKRRGMGLAGLLTCSLGSPWHIMQPTLTGARASALVPCLPAQTRWALAWQFAQYLPLLMSSADGDWARAPEGTRKAAQHAVSSARNTAVPALASARTLLPCRCCTESVHFPGRRLPTRSRHCTLSARARRYWTKVQ